MKKKIYWIVGLFALLLSIVPVILYLSFFGNWRLSRLFSEWRDFSDFLSPYLTISVGILTGFVAFLAYKISEQAYRFSENAEKPLITFESVKLGGNSYYVIKNAGKVPAINCRLLVKPTQSNNSQTWDYEILCYTIKPEEVKIISWEKGVFATLMIYQSFSNKMHCTYMENDINIFDNPKFLKYKHNESAFRYSEKTDTKVESEILQIISGSSERKEDMRVIQQLMLQKSQDCSKLFLEQIGKTQYVHEHFFASINEIIISIQLLDSTANALESVYISTKRNFFLEQFWIQLDVSVRFYLKKAYADRLNAASGDIFGSHLTTIFETFKQFFEKY